MKTRKEYLAVCQVCEKSAFDKKKGIICSLTGAHANYETAKCPDYVSDEKAIKRAEAATRRELDAKEDNKGLWSKNIGMTGGIVLISLALVWMVIGIVFLDRIFIYPLILVVAGILAISNGAKKKKAVQKAAGSDVLDDEII